MSDPQFFASPAGLSLGDLATTVGAAQCEPGLLNRRVTGIATLDQAGPDDLVFCDSEKFLPQLALTHACACLVSARFADSVPNGVTALIVDKPYLAFVAASRALFPDALRPSSLFAAVGHRGAFVDPSARLEAGVQIDVGAVICGGAEIGSGTAIGSGTVIGPQVRIGRGCAIGAATTITHSLIGDRVVIHPGCRIGQDGFGYIPTAKGHMKVPQVGRVIIQDDAEIGANCTIDRGGLRDTVIGEGTKIDNLVQVGHNTVIGRHCIVVAQTGLSGSVTIGDGAVLGGQVGIADHVSIGAGAMLAAKTGVMHDVSPGARVAGYPARSSQQWLRETVTLERLARRRAGKADAGSDRPERNSDD